MVTLPADLSDTVKVCVRPLWMAFEELNNLLRLPFLPFREIVTIQWVIQPFAISIRMRQNIINVHGIIFC